MYHILRQIVVVHNLVNVSNLVGWGTGGIICIVQPAATLQLLKPNSALQGPHFTNYVHLVNFYNESVIKFYKRYVSSPMGFNDIFSLFFLVI